MQRTAVVRFPDKHRIKTPQNMPDRQKQDVAYVDDMRRRLDRFSNRIDEMSLVKQQQTERIKSLESQVESLESALLAAKHPLPV